MNKFAETKNWRLRRRLDRYLTELSEAVEGAVGSRNRRQWDKENFEFCLKQITLWAPRLVKFYKKHK